MSSFTDREPALTAHPGISAPPVERVLFALTSAERDQIFPSFDFDSRFPAAAPCQCVDPEVLLSSFHNDWPRFLQQVRPTILVSCWSTPPLPPSLLSDDSFPLRYVCHTTGSVKRVVPRTFVAQGGRVTNWGNLISHTVAEHALLLILASLRNLSCWHPISQPSLNGYWGNGFKLRTQSLRGRRVGIHGFGNVARDLIRLLAPFEVTCMAYSENVSSQHMAEYGALPCDNLDTLFKRNDILVECEALTRETTGIVTERHFQLMEQDAVFVNIARGPIVDEQALAKLAAQGRIRVASDVFHNEPLPADSPLRHIDNLIISPHIGGPTSDWYPRCGDFALANIGRYLAGEPLEGVVTPEIYDRST